MKRRTNRRPCRPHLLAIAAMLLLLTAPRSGFSLGPWTNGQAANLVLGQPDFTTARNCDIEECNGADRMYGPQSVAVDPTTGKVFVADSLNSRVLRFASGAALTSGAAAEAVLGQPDFTTIANNVVTAAKMSLPQALVVDAGGRLWVADSGYSRVLRFDNAAAKTSGADADGVLGQIDFVSGLLSGGGDGMCDPEGLAVDADGRLWVADTWHSRILRFDNAAAKANGAYADAVFGQANFTEYDYATARNRMHYPRGLTVTATGALFVADRGNDRVLRFDNAAGKGNGADADGVLGQADFISNGVGYHTRNGMWSPTGVSCDSEGRLYVVEGEGSNNRVLIFNNAAALANGADADNVLGQPDFTTSDATRSASGLYSPIGVFADNAGGVLWVADRGHNRVLRYVGQTVSAYALTVSKNGTGSGAVTSNPPGISCGTACGASFTAGQSVTLTAAAASGSAFAGWSGACSGTGSCVVTMDADKSVTATFTVNAAGSVLPWLPAVQQLLLKK
ncbi:MAG: InlB B-repeat-containing protein [Candidatus Electronema sp. V4]|uniref:InlB B-repeat-containing protein n=1 Tax=Candidatus Electronema sp. V4 TaxID=3454756 RepID=UPI0040558845